VIQKKMIQLSQLTKLISVNYIAHYKYLTFR